MRFFILLLSAYSAWGQIAITYASASGTTYQNTLLFNTATVGYQITFSAPSATSVSGASFYSTARATANVDALTANVIEVFGNTIGGVVTYTDVSDLVNLTNHNLANGDKVHFSTATTLPTGLVLNADYYVCNATTTTFQVDDSAGCGSIVTDFSGSSGTQYVSKIVATSTTFTPSPVTSATWIDFSSFSAHTLVAGRKYAVQFLNTEGAPGTDTVTIAYLSSEAPSLNPVIQGSIVGSVASTTAQAVGTNVSGRATGYVELASGLKIGNTVYNNESSSNMRINGTRRAGVKFTTPSNVSYNVQKLGVQIRNTLATTTTPKTLTMELYSIGSSTDTLVDSCDVSLLAGTTNNINAQWCYLGTARALNTGSSYRLVAFATGSAGDSSNYIVMPSFTYRSSETTDIPLSIQATYCASSCTTTANWTNEAAKTSSLILGLDSTTPYAPISANGGSFVVAQ